jgi:hypothetical protein
MGYGGLEQNFSWPSPGHHSVCLGLPQSSFVIDLLPSRLIRRWQSYSTDLVFRKENVDSCDVGSWSAFCCCAARSTGLLGPWPPAGRGRWTEAGPSARSRVRSDGGRPQHRSRREIPRSSRRCGRTAESHSVLHSTFAFDAVDFRAWRNLAKILIFATHQRLSCIRVTPLPIFRDGPYDQKQIEADCPRPPHQGQVEAVERALEAEIGCADVLMLVASLRGPSKA